MFRKAVYRTLLIATLTSGCVVTPPDAGTETKEPTTIIFTATATERSVLQGSEPNVEKICPSSAEVRINELGLPNNLVLLAVNEDEILGDTNHPLRSNILLFSSNKLTPNQIDKIISFDDDLVVDVRLSPSGLWISIIRWHENSQQKTVWISRIDGEKQMMVADVDRTQRVFWISDSEILVVGVPDEADYEGGIPEEDMRPLLSINILTLVTRNLEPLPDGAIYVYGSYHSLNENHYSMYYKDENQKRDYFLYDYLNKASTQIFRWVNSPDNSVAVGSRPNGLYFVEQGLGLGVDFALDLNIKQITEDKIYNDVMKHLAIDHIQALEITSMMASLTKNDILILTSDPLDHEKSTPMYLFDYKANILKDYCINLGVVSTVFSPDEQFVAFTVNEGIDNPGYHVLILDLKSGYYSIVENIKAIGFGVVR